MGSDTKQANVCWLTGNYHDRKRIINKVKDLLSSHGELECVVCDNETPLVRLQSLISRRGCFEKQRLIILNDWPDTTISNATLYNKFLKMCELVPEGVVLICNNLKTDAKKFLEGINAIAKVYSFEEEMWQNQADAWVVVEMSRREKEISTSNASIITSAVGTTESGYMVSIDKLHAMCSLLSFYVGKRKSITKEDVVAVCADSSSFVIWNLYNHLDAKDYISSIKMLNHRANVSKTARTFAEQVLHSMIWRYRILFFAKEATSSNMTMTDVIASASEWYKIKKTGSGLSCKCTYDLTEKDNRPKPIYNQKVIEKLFDGKYRKPPVVSYSRQSTYRILQILERALQRVRYGCTENEIIILLDTVVMLICGKIDYDMLDKAWRTNYGAIC